MCQANLSIDKQNDIPTPTPSTSIAPKYYIYKYPKNPPKNLDNREMRAINKTLVWLCCALACIINGTHEKKGVKIE